MQLFLFKKYGLSPCEINTGGAIVDKLNAQQVLALVWDLSLGSDRELRAALPG